MALWEELAQPATLGEVELPITRRRIRGARAYGRKELPYVSGQETEPTGRGPRVIEVQTELFADVDPAHYPGIYEDLVAVLEDDELGGKMVWVDPIWGPINVVVTQWEAVEDAQERDGVVVQLTLEEDGFVGRERSETWLFTASDRSRAETDAAELDAVRVEAGIDDETLELAWEGSGYARGDDETLAFADSVASMIVSVDEGAQRIEEIAGKVDRIRARTQALVELAQAQSPDAWVVLERGMRLIETVQRVGDEALAAAGRPITHRTRGWTSVFELAVELYGTRERADEILRRNAIPHPLFIAPGTALSVIAP